MKKHYYILFYLRDLCVLCGHYTILNKFTTSPKAENSSAEFTVPFCDLKNLHYIFIRSAVVHVDAAYPHL